MTQEPSKTSKDENFPVASILLPSKYRFPILAFYDFARTADDVADHPAMSAKEKLDRLDLIERILTGKEKTIPKDLECVNKLREVLAYMRISEQTSLDLLTAFKMDAENKPVKTWEDLLTYCRYSANPVGRFVLRVFEEPDMTLFPGDSLCTAFQILNHVQDCQKDYMTLRRVYIPEEWLKDERLTVNALTNIETPPALQKVFDRLLEGVRGQLTDAGTLPFVVENKALRMEVSIMYRLASRLLGRLETHDILKKPVKLTKTDWAKSVIGGIIAGRKKRKQTV